MVADAIYDILKSSVGVAWPLSIGDLPATTETAVGIMEFEGYDNVEYFGTQSGNTLSSPVVKVVVRNASYAEGQTWCDAIKDTLHRYHDTILLSVLVVGGPMYLGRGVTKLHEFQVTFQTRIKE